MEFHVSSPSLTGERKQEKKHAGWNRDCFFEQ